MQEADLSGHTVAVPETRELDVFCAMLERRGARVWRCPLVAIKDAPDPDPVIAWIRAFCNDSFDDLILLRSDGTPQEAQAGMPGFDTQSTLGPQQRRWVARGPPRRPTRQRVACPSRRA